MSNTCEYPRERSQLLILLHKEITKRMGTNINIDQRIIQRKLNFSGHICRMRADRLLKQVLFGRNDGKNKRRRPKRRWQTTWWTGARKILAPCTEWQQTVPSGTYQLVRDVIDTTGQWAHGIKERRKKNSRSPTKCCCWPKKVFKFCVDQICSFKHITVQRLSKFGLKCLQIVPKFRFWGQISTPKHDWWDH